MDTQTFNRKEIKQWQRERIYRKVSRLLRLYGQNATEMIIGAIFIPAGFLGTLIVVGNI